MPEETNKSDNNIAEATNISIETEEINLSAGNNAESTNKAIDDNNAETKENKEEEEEKSKTDVEGVNKTDNNANNKTLTKQQQLQQLQEQQQHDSTIWHRILYPAGVKPYHRKYEHWVGRVGFGAKGVLYGLVGGMTCASATKNQLNASPQGAFILIGDFPSGDGIRVVMLVTLLCYIVWRWWEAFLYQGADATFSPFKNFFAFRLSPFVSGCVYIAYSYYIVEIFFKTNGTSCYPGCWQHTAIGKAALVLFGLAFSIACFTQLLNAFTKKWHFEIAWAKCNKFEKYMILTLGHVGFVGRSGLFLFVGILMFRALKGNVHTSGNTISNGVNQFINNPTGRAFSFIIGFMTVLYGLYAILCTRYKIFPTPPPSGIALIYRYGDHSTKKISEREVDMVKIDV